MARFSTAVALVLTLVASNAATFVCLSDCARPRSAPLKAHQAAERPAVDGSCHRDGEGDAGAEVTRVGGAPHDCRSHATDVTSILSTPRQTAAAPLRAAMTPGIVGHDAFDASRLRAISAVVSLHDLAPPGPPPAVGAPLRI